MKDLGKELFLVDGNLADYVVNVIIDCKENLMLRDWENVFGYNRESYEDYEDYENDLRPFVIDLYEKGLHVKINKNDIQQTRAWEEDSCNMTEEEAEKMYPNYDRIFLFDESIKIPDTKLKEGQVFIFRASVEHDDKLFAEKIGTEVKIGFILDGKIVEEQICKISSVVYLE